MEKVKLNLDADVQSEYRSTNVMAGIERLRVMVKFASFTLPVEMTITTRTNRTRGVHMSRLVEAAFKNSEVKHIEEGMARIIDDVQKTQGPAYVSVNFDYPFKDVFVKVRISLKGKRFLYVLSVPGITACPCSREVAGIGHMQRAWLSIAIPSRKYVDIEEVIVKMQECFSSTTSELMKRPEEGLKVLDSQANPKFVEDVVRDAVKRFPNAMMIKAKSEESIHMHDAVAYVYRKNSASFFDEMLWFS
ncbi:MAG: GTP cyclohydrolase, FolE2/MptA family [Conexivisphaerales archaeon]